MKRHRKSTEQCLVISDDAKNESARLGRQCFVVKPFKLTDEKIQQVTAIDGAVLVDRDCVCHAIGVILDGLATKKGDPARGARYNSALRYYELSNKKTPLVIVIISEDGMINLIPDLLPQIKHSDITKAMADFKKVYESEEFDRKSYFPLINFLESVEFYLSKSECEEINSCRKNIEEKFNEEFGPIHFVRNDLKSHEEMNESFYFVEK